MGKKATVFENTYREYLAQIAGIDFLSRAELLGAERAGNALVIPFYKEPYRVSADGVIDSLGKPANFAKSVVLCRYILQCPEDIPVGGSWVSYREFKDAGPLVSYFTSNTNKIIETAYTGNASALKTACESLGG